MAVSHACPSGRSSHRSRLKNMERRLAQPNGGRDVAPKPPCRSDRRRCARPRRSRDRRERRPRPPAPARSPRQPRSRSRGSGTHRPPRTPWPGWPARRRWQHRSRLRERVRHGARRAAWPIRRARPGGSGTGSGTHPPAWTPWPRSPARRRWQHRSRLRERVRHGARRAAWPIRRARPSGSGPVVGRRGAARVGPGAPPRGRAGSGHQAGSTSTSAPAGSSPSPRGTIASPSAPSIELSWCEPCGPVGVARPSRRRTRTHSSRSA
jgi:hypothetical protein